MSVADLTSPTAIKLAIEECNRLGRDRFLNQYGFRRAREYALRYDGREYDSKAIVGVAHGFQFPIIGPLKSAEFSGGISDSGAAAKAFSLGFDVEGKKRRPIDWTLDECEKAIEAYFYGLASIMSGQAFNRAEACRSQAFARAASIASTNAQTLLSTAEAESRGADTLAKIAATNKPLIDSYEDQGSQSLTLPALLSLPMRLPISKSITSRHSHAPY